MAKLIHIEIHIDNDGEISNRIKDVDLQTFRIDVIRIVAFSGFIFLHNCVIKNIYEANYGLISMISISRI